MPPSRRRSTGKLKPLTEGKRVAPVDIWQVAVHLKQWVRQVEGTERMYYRAIGFGRRSTCPELPANEAQASAYQVPRPAP